MTLTSDVDKPVPDSWRACVAHGSRILSRSGDVIGEARDETEAESLASIMRARREHDDILSYGAWRKHFVEIHRRVLGSNDLARLEAECRGGVDQVEATFTLKGAIDTLAVKPWGAGGRWFDVDDEGVRLSDRGGRLDDASTPLRYVGNMPGLLRRRFSRPGEDNPVSKALRVLEMTVQ